MNLADQPPLLQAIFQNNFNAVHNLILNREDLTWRDSQGRSLLHAVAFVGNAEVADLLILSGVRSNKSDYNFATALHIACRNGHETVVEILLRHNLELANCRDKNWQTALHVCASFGHVACASYVVALSKDVVNQCDKFGRSALHYACFNGFTELVQLLVSFGGDLDIADKLNRRPIHWAAFQGHSEVIRQLMDAGSSIDVYDSELCSPLHFAVASDNFSCVSVLLEGLSRKDQVRYVNKSDHSGNTALHYAAIHGALKCANLLIRSGADTDAVNHECMTPLHCAARSHSNCGLIKLLLKHGANAKALTNHGKCALHYAVCNNNTNPLQVRALIDAGASVNIEDVDGFSPLHGCCFFGNINGLKVLLENGADVNNINDKDGRNCVHYAVVGDSQSLIKCLAVLSAKGTSVVDFGSCIFSALDNLKRSPLHYAAMHGNWIALNFFVNNVITLDLNAVDNFHRTPLHYAARFDKDGSCCKVLLSKGANPLIQDVNHFTAIHYASVNHCDAVLETLLEYTSRNSSNSCFINQKDRTLSPLHLAAHFGNEAIAVALFKMGCDIDSLDSNGCSPLLLAVSSSNWSVTKWLIEHDAKGSAANNSGLTPIHLAASTGRMDILSMFIANQDQMDIVNLLDAKKSGAIEDLTSVLLPSKDAQKLAAFCADSSNCTLLHRAAATGNYSICLQLIQFGASIAVKDINGRTALHYAAQNGHTKCLSILLEELTSEIERSGSQLNMKNVLLDNRLFTPLHWAAYKNHSSCVQLHLENNVDLKWGNRFSPVHCAVMASDESCLDVLLQHIDTDACVNGYLFDESYWSPLHVACCLGKKDCVQSLLPNEVHINSLDKYGRTPLTYAAMKGFFDIVETMLKHGAELIADKLKNTALHYCCLKRYENVATLLIDSISNINLINAQNYDRKSALHIAAANGLPSVVEKLLLKGANISLVDDNGFTAALCCARNNATAECLSMLITAYTLYGCTTPDTSTASKSFSTPHFSRTSNILRSKKAMDMNNTPPIITNGDGSEPNSDCDFY